MPGLGMMTSGHRGALEFLAGVLVLVHLAGHPDSEKQFTLGSCFSLIPTARKLPDASHCAAHHVLACDATTDSADNSSPLSTQC